MLFTFLGLHQKWWRYFNLGDSWAIVRACIVASALLLAVFTLAQPFPINIPRSVLILDFLFTIGLLVAGRASSASSTRTTGATGSGAGDGTGGSQRPTC